MRMVKGTDLSEFQPRVDYRQLRIDGYLFAFIKCTDGLWVDPMYKTHVKGCRDEGIEIGCYAINHPSRYVQAQADFFLEHADMKELRPVSDMETLATNDKGVKVVPPNAAEWDDQWSEIVKQALVRLYPDSFRARKGPITYASASYWMTMCTLKPVIGGPLGWDWWNADYTGTPNQPRTLGGVPLPPYIAHQFAGNVSMPGQTGLWDMDAVYDDNYDVLRV